MMVVDFGVNVVDGFYVVQRVCCKTCNKLILAIHAVCCVSVQQHIPKDPFVVFQACAAEHLAHGRVSTPCIWI